MNVSLPDSLLDEVDELATSLGRSRSGFVQEATALYVARVRDERAAEERRVSIQQAITGMRELAKHLPDGEDTTAIIRADRDSDHGRRTPDGR
ncbi:MAG: ribbon-helix-helix protein, CopG family [Actinomycetota bacterium]|nr:ribbon-helix-helix protein, CopG family [Actinomycetota bacterium]MDP3629358.1 ribbon-helix-helix protein, CopG family [Actinomycetota bacterium]